MCVNMLKMASSFGAGVEGGGNMQASGQVLNAIASLAGGSARAGALKSEAAMVQTGAQMRAGAIRRDAVLETGAARAAATASGVKVGSGSVLEAERAIARYSEQDALSAIISGNAQAGALRTRAAGERSAGMVGASENLLMAADTWRRTRRPSTSATWERLNKEDWR